MKVVIFESEPWIRTAWQATGARLDTVWVEGLLTAERAGKFSDADIVSVDMSILDETSLAVFKRLKMISLRATGVDNVDLDFCRKNGITVCNVPAYARIAVAEHVFALLLAIGRHMVEATRRTERLDFSWDGLQGFELNGKVMAVIGTGAIGRRVAAIANGFGMDVVAFDAFPDEDWAGDNDVRYLSFEAALKAADIVTLHVPGRPETEHLISSQSFALMKDGVVIVNTSRGDVVEPGALLEALSSGKVAAAGLDVLVEENTLADENSRLRTVQDGSVDRRAQLTNHLLLQHPRVLVTPHCAFYTGEAAERLIRVTVGNIESFVGGGDIVNRVVL